MGGSRKTPVLAYSKEYAFNAICPYFTMFPIEFPMKILRKHREATPTVIDPFCGRGTTIYAARKYGFKCIGLDTSPIAVAIARAKLASASLEEIIQLAEKYIAHAPKQVPDTPFFKRAFSRRTLVQLCSLREGLLREKNETGASVILRAAALGCLHGPLPANGGSNSYFSNQMPRTFSSKPEYSVQYWKDRELSPPNVSVVEVIRKKLNRIPDLKSDTPCKYTNVKCSDARKAASYRSVSGPVITITSPPYYGMRSYVQDQWLRMWFLGGDEEVEYENDYQLSHDGHDRFIKDLAKVWSNIWKKSDQNSHLYIRFGSILSAKSNAKEILQASLEEAGGWKVISVRNADTARSGKRQADLMGQHSNPEREYDFHASVL